MCGITNVIGTQYLLPTKRQKEYTISVLAGLIFNVIFNAFLIPNYGAYGAALMTTLAQTLVVIIQCAYIRKDINIKSALTCGINYAIASIIMFLVCIFIGLIIKNALLAIMLKVVFGALAYGLILIILKDEYVKLIFELLKSKFKKA